LSNESTVVLEEVKSHSKVKDFLALAKLRLTSLVVFSAVLGYFMAATTVNFLSLAYLIIGGFLVTGSSNAFNQVIEREADKKMNRTSDRPLPAGRMGVSEASIMASIWGVLGIALLWFGLNPLSGILAALSLFIYVFLYTPLKKVGPIAVFVGAFPGAIPPMLGYVAETGSFGLIPGLLFATQFIWQFPHFWSIAWKLHDDYAKAGYQLLPTRKRDKTSAMQIVIYALFLIPISLAPFWFGIGGWVGFSIVLFAGVISAILAARLFLKRDMKSATVLMFSTFIYLPVVQLAYLMSF
jgi:protoheme IX farnesyltransferase|tara:strand:+ start:49614 stop:50501 length:888 start_codon:yes stop_codon:yes gene_type:complete